MKRSLLFILLLLIVTNVNAQPYLLKSAGEAKEFRLTLYFGTKGKGAFVQYLGHQGIIPLQIKNFKADHTGSQNGESSSSTYLWNEVIDGKVTGSYGLTERMGETSDIWYQRKKDGKRFTLEPADENQQRYDDTYFLHGALISFNHSSDDLLVLSYAYGKSKAVHLPGFDSPDATRQGEIADYNFDGYDDVAFSIPDAGMGVYREFSIWLYNPKSRQFEKFRSRITPGPTALGFTMLRSTHKENYYSAPVVAEPTGGRTCTGLKTLKSWFG